VPEASLIWETFLSRSIFRSAAHSHHEPRVNGPLWAAGVLGFRSDALSTVAVTRSVRVEDVFSARCSGLRDASPQGGGAGNRSLLRRQHGTPGADGEVRTPGLPLTRRQAMGFYMGKKDFSLAGAHGVFPPPFVPRAPAGRSRLATPGLGWARCLETDARPKAARSELTAWSGGARRGGWNSVNRRDLACVGFTRTGALGFRPVRGDALADPRASPSSRRPSREPTVSRSLAAGWWPAPGHRAFQQSWTSTRDSPQGALHRPAPG
jgi:hypothetical protein